MLALRFYGNRTQAETADELGISQMHVSRLLSRALTWLREAMLSDDPPDWENGTRGGRPGMHVSVARDGAALRVRVRGEVDRDTAGRLRIGLRHAISGDGVSAVTVDLTAVPLVDAAGVAVLVEAVQSAAAAGVEFGVTGAQPYVARILAVSGLAGALRPDLTADRDHR
jgi:RNA polymerase sigma-B factor